MPSREDQLIDERHEQVMNGIQGIHTRLDDLNGRTRTLEIEQGKLKWAIGTISATITGFFAWLVKG